MMYARYNAATKRAEIFIYEDIGEGWYGGLSAKAFSERMAEVRKEKAKALDIYINSYGGSVFDGIAIYNQIKRFEGEKIVHIDGIAASIASVIAMAGDTINIAANGTMMIHNAWGMAVGTAEDMRAMAESLELTNGTIRDTYVARTKAADKDVRAWMDAETWMNADQCVERGFADAKTSAASESAIAAAATSKLLAQFKHAPAALKARGRDTDVMLARMQMRTAKFAGREPAKA